MRNLLTALLTTGALLGAVGSASAASVGTSFTVSATVLKTCSVAATNLGFGNYTPGSGPQSAVSTISVNCTKGTGWTVLLDKGTTAGGTVAQRLMAQGGGGAGTLQYSLCTTAVLATGLCNGGTAWGDGTGGTITQTGTGNGMGAGNVQTLTVNGGLPDNAFNQGAAVAASGSSPYSDTVAVTVNY